MKHLTRKRLLSLLLALVMVLSLTPTALLAPEEGTDENDTTTGDTSTDDTTTDDTTTGDSEPSASGDVLSFVLTQGSSRFEPSNGMLLTQTGNAPSMRVTISARNASGEAIRTHDDDHIGWESSDPDVAEPHVLKDSSGGQETGRTFLIEGKKPGVATITGTVTDPNGNPLAVAEIYRTIRFTVVVSGILPNSSEVSIKENESKTFTSYTVTLEDMSAIGEIDKEDPFGVVYYGAAATGAVSISSNLPNVVDVTGSDRRGLGIDGISAGTAAVTISVGSYIAPITVTVEPDLSWVIKASASTSNPLKFADLEAQIAQQCQEAIEGDAALDYITGLSVSTTQGIIYLGYMSPDDTGSGAGSALNYYASNQPRGPYIKDLTFVPSASYTGSTATISYTGHATNGRTFKGKIEVTLEDTTTDVTLTTRSDVPLKLAAENFSKVCQEQTGAPLSYVVFTLPPATEGVLYRDYKSELDYAARVSAAEQYDRKGLDDITFVPAVGFVGTVTIGYAGYSTTGSKYTGELVIKVTRSLDENIQYQDYGAGEVYFSGSDFDDYCFAMTGEEMRSAGRITFTLPPASQGTLYYRRSGRGSAVPADNSYSLTQLDYIVFVAADGFDGVVRIPFTGTDRYGTAFSGTVELHIQASAVSRYGDINYTCQPGQSVKLELTDFANLCQSVTGDRLYYVAFQSLPDYTQGSLFYNRTSAGSIGTRVTTAAKYFNSAVPYLSNVSFWAAEGFRSVEIPFTLASVNQQTVTGLMVITSGSGAGGGTAGAVTYTTSGQQPVAFSGAKFDTACRQATNAALNYLRFTLPSSGQGILYYDYKEGVTPTAFDPSTALYLTGDVSIDKVTFVPASGFSGVAYIPFTATAINGTVFQGSVEVTVRAGAAYGSIVRYSTGGAPVRFQSYDLTVASGIGQPASIRFTGMPSASQGRVYYQYASVTRYSWLGSTTTSYSVTGDPLVSNLTFIPRAGYQGVVTIPYTVTGYDGSTSTGSIEITVALPAASAAFDDLADYSAQTKSAVDCLFSMGIVTGVAARTYDPGASIRRGDFCLMVSRAFQFNVAGTNRTFADVAASAYYAQAVNEMYALGVVNGVGGGYFSPTASITRQDAAVMVCRALEKAGLTLPEGSNEAALAGYKDRNQVSDYARDALGSMVRAGVFPVSGDQLSPKTAITRADMAVLLHRAITNFS